MPEPPPLRFRRPLNSLDLGRHAGSTLRLVIQGRDSYSFPKPSLYMHHQDTVNRGVHLIHTGGPTDSFLLIPLVRL